MRAIVTVVGKDTVGILARVSGICAKFNVNVVDVSQTVMQDMFCMIMLVDTAESVIPFSGLAEALENAGKDMNLSIRAMHEEIFETMHRI